MQGSSVFRVKALRLHQHRRSNSLNNEEKYEGHQYRYDDIVIDNSQCDDDASDSQCPTSCKNKEIANLSVAYCDIFGEPRHYLANGIGIEELDGGSQCALDHLLVELGAAVEDHVEVKDSSEYNHHYKEDG
jgi:hypothetical protein